MEPGERGQRCGLRSGAVVVDEDEKRDLLLADERAGVALITGSNRDDLRAQTGDFVEVLAQLRSMVPAVQSTEMSEEHQHNWAVTPEIAEPMRRTRTVGERGSGQRGEVHPMTLPV